MKPLPDLRRLQVDVATQGGVYAAGLLVHVLGGRRESDRLRVCLDGPGFHLGRCRQVYLPRYVLTPRVSQGRRSAAA